MSEIPLKVEGWHKVDGCGSVAEKIIDILVWKAIYHQTGFTMFGRKISVGSIFTEKWLGIRDTP